MVTLATVWTPKAASARASPSGRAAHVERDQVGEAGLPARLLGRDHAGGRTGLDDLGRRPRRGLGRHDPAVRLHDVEVGRYAGGGDARGQGPEVAVDDRADVG